MNWRNAELLLKNTDIWGILIDLLASVRLLGTGAPVQAIAPTAAVEHRLSRRSINSFVVPTTARVGFEDERRRKISTLDGFNPPTDSLACGVCQ